MTAPLTRERLAEIDERIAKATPGPWELRGGGNFTDFGAPGFVEYCNDNGDSATSLKLGNTNWPWPWDDEVRPTAEANAEFIVHSRTDLPDLRESHRELVEALKGSYDFVRLIFGPKFDNEQEMKNTRAALRNAGVPE